MTVTFIPGRTSGSRNVIHDGYHYCLDKKRDDKTYWRCTVKTCSGTVENMDRLAEAFHLVIDGTFSTSPNLFTQLVTVHGLYPDGWRIPLAFGYTSPERRKPITKPSWMCFMPSESTLNLS